MIIFKSREQLRNHLDSIRKEKKIIGFVPTMGALHQGHISLILAAKQESEVVICSIFVNPMQFNDPRDLDKYPRTLVHDREMLERAGCDILFAPDIHEMYSSSEISHNTAGLDDSSWKEGKAVDFGDLDKVMEAEHRPGHFNGVAQVVSRLFRIIEPDKAWFGQKDFQQLAVIKSMVRQLEMPVEIHSAPIIREPDGLAMSSRNVRLSASERAEAPLIYKALQAAKAAWANESPAAVRQLVRDKIAASANMKLEYFEIADPETLLPVNEKTDHACPVACIAVRLGPVRLIDNMVLC